MPTDQNTSEQIERYLSGAMSGAEREAFDAAKKQDPALAETFELHRALHQSLGNTQRRKLLDALSEVVEKEENKKRGLTVQWRSFPRIAVAATILLAAAVGIWFYNQPAEDKPSFVESPVVQPKPEVVSPQPAPVYETPTTAKQLDQGPLASADRRAFSANRALDPMVGTMVRGGGEVLSVEKPGIDAVFPLQKGKADFRIEGTAAGMTALQLNIYNNSDADFVAGKAVFTVEVPVNETGFAFAKKIALKPGVYYAVLSAPGDEEPLTVVRFYAGSR